MRELLEIPASVHDLCRALLRAAAPIIVAAELRRLANEMSYAPACQTLEARADDLDPGGAP
jgi:hypothetical protein